MRYPTDNLTPETSRRNASAKRQYARIEWQAPANDDRANRFYAGLEVPVIEGWKYYRMGDPLSDNAAKYHRLYRNGDEQ
jgi:hypothetical protein